MRPSRVLVVAIGFVLILGSEVVYTVVLATPDGIRMRSPEPRSTLDRSFVTAGDAWLRGGIASIEVEATRASQGTERFPAARDAVRYHGKTVFLLSSWTARLSLPEDGSWELRATVKGVDGTQAATGTRTISIQAGRPPRQFQAWTAEHLIPIAIIIAASIGLGLFTRGSRTRTGTPPLEGRGSTPLERRLDRVALALTSVLWVNEFVYQLYWFLVGGWSVASSLMLQMCGLSILLLPVLFFSRAQRVRQFLFDLLFFWGIGGAIQALVSPDIGANSFPAWRYFSFFLSHGLIIVSTTVMAFAGGVRITLRSVARVFVVTNILLLPMYGIDRALALLPPYDPGNYFVLGYPPPTGSIVDLFSEWFGPAPRYLIGLELMGIAIFAILYLPWPIARRIALRASGGPRGEDRA